MSVEPLTLVWREVLNEFFLLSIDPVGPRMCTPRPSKARRVFRVSSFPIRLCHGFLQISPLCQMVYNDQLLVVVCLEKYTALQASLCNELRGLCCGPRFPNQACCFCFVCQSDLFSVKNWFFFCLNGTLCLQAALCEELGVYWASRTKPVSLRSQWKKL